MTEAKFRDIISNMIEMDVIDPCRAMLDKDYLVRSINNYVSAANTARKYLNIEPIV